MVAQGKQVNERLQTRNQLPTMSIQPDVTPLEQLEAKHDRDIEDDFDEIGPAKACFFLTCLAGSDSDST